jgi:hypothetical protein
MHALLLVHAREFSVGSPGQLVQKKKKKKFSFGLFIFAIKMPARW